MNRKISKLMLIFLSVGFLFACYLFINNITSRGDTTEVNFSVSEIQKIEVVNGKNGISIEIDSKESYDKIKELINESTYQLKNDDEDKTGWIIGVKIYYDGMHHWYMPEGVDNYTYENKNFYDELLQIILEEKSIDFVEEYLN